MGCTCAHVMDYSPVNAAVSAISQWETAAGGCVMLSLAKTTYVQHATLTTPVHDLAQAHCCVGVNEEEVIER